MLSIGCSRLSAGQGRLPFLGRWFGPTAHALPRISRVALGVLFIVAGALKINHAAELAATIASFRLGIPGPLVATIAVALPPFEMLLGLYLLWGRLLFAASLAASVLLLSFIVVLSSVVARGLSVSCGCFGPGDAEPATWTTVLRDGIAIVPAVYLLWWSRARRERSPETTAL
ncbi:MAG: MauE/DoxX family redox-associated membrane protein [Candidatus Eremiobacter antarcticus]